jgi:FixJ family two-component response regulator
MTSGTAKPPLIAIVDDDALVRAAVCKLIRSVGYATCAFASAEDFLESSAKHGTSCVVCDVQLPRANGLDLQTQLNSEDSAPPVIFMTAYPNARLRERALAAGAVCFLHKPFDGWVLKRCLETALGTMLDS